jgi:cytochrome P450
VRHAQAEGARRDHDRRRDLSRFDPTEPAFLADPYPRLAALREATPLFYEEPLERWFVTRHTDVRACLRDRRLGRNFRHVGSEEDFDAAEPLDPRWQPFWDTERWSLLWLEPPEHTRSRKLVAAAFTPRSVEALREPCAELARDLLPHGGFELLGDFAQPYSIAVICRLLGVPTDRGRDLLDWSHTMVKMYELDTTEAQAEAATAAAAEFRAYVVSLIDERRRVPRDDLVTRLVQARIESERLTDAQIVSTIIVLLNAGHEATVNTLGNGVLALLHHREQWERLAAGEVAPAAAVEELIRWDPPLQLFERWVLEEGVEIARRPVPRGAKVALLFGSANRDPRVFDEPDAFDVGRPNAAEHIGFGGGIHVCIGAPLARIELEAALRALVEGAPALELAEQPQRNRAFVIWGLDRLELCA